MTAPVGSLTVPVSGRPVHLGVRGDGRAARERRGASASWEPPRLGWGPAGSWVGGMLHRRARPRASRGCRLRSAPPGGEGQIPLPAMTPLLFPLLLAAAPPLHEQAFRLERAAEAVAVDPGLVRALRLGREGPRGRRARARPRRRALAAPRADPRRARRSTASCSGALPGASTGSPSRSTRALGAAGAGRCGSRASTWKPWPRASPGTRSSPTRPSSTRAGSLDRFSDVPLVAWVETHPARTAGGSCATRSSSATRTAAPRSTG